MKDTDMLSNIYENVRRYEYSSTTWQNITKQYFKRNQKHGNQSSEEEDQISFQHLSC